MEGESKISVDNDAAQQNCTIEIDFAGFKPICSGKEIMILHNPRNVPTGFYELKLTAEFEFLREYVKKMYESRCLIENQ